MLIYYIRIIIPTDIEFYQNVSKTKPQYSCNSTPYRLLRLFPTPFLTRIVFRNDEHAIRRE